MQAATAQLMACSGKLVTVGFSMGGTLTGNDMTSLKHDTKATDLSLAGALEVGACSFGDDIDQAVHSYDHPHLRPRYTQRFGGPSRGVPACVAGGVVKRK